MSAAEKSLYDAIERLPTRGMGALADCPLARVYGWSAPVEDYLRKKGGLGHRERAAVNYREHTTSVSVASHVRPVATIVDRIVRATPTPKTVVAPVKRKRRTSEEVDVVVAAYLRFCQEPYRRGAFKALAASYGYDTHALMITLIHRKVWRARRGIV